MARIAPPKPPVAVIRPTASAEQPRNIAFDQERYAAVSIAFWGKPHKLRAARALIDAEPEISAAKVIGWTDRHVPDPGPTQASLSNRGVLPDSLGNKAN